MNSMLITYLYKYLFSLWMCIDVVYGVHRRGPDSFIYLQTFRRRRSNNNNIQPIEKNRFLFSSHFSKRSSSNLRVEYVLDRIDDEQMGSSYIRLISVHVCVNWFLKFNSIFLFLFCFTLWSSSSYVYFWRIILLFPLLFLWALLHFLSFLLLLKHKLLKMTIEFFVCVQTKRLFVVERRFAQQCYEECITMWPTQQIYLPTIRFFGKKPGILARYAILGYSGMHRLKLWSLITYITFNEINLRIFFHQHQFYTFYIAFFFVLK